MIEIGYAKVLACRVRRFGLPLYDVKACEALTARSGLLRFRKALSFAPSACQRKRTNPTTTRHHFADVSGFDQPIFMGIGDGALHRPVSRFLQGGKFLARQPHVA